MRNKFKVKNKIISIALALALATQPLASFPMNVFAGTGSNGAITAPTVNYNFDIDNVIELAKGDKFDVTKYVKNIQPQGATANYTVESQTVFRDDDAKIFDDDGKVANPGFAKVKVTIGSVSKETWVNADINEILNAAKGAAANADVKTAWKAAKNACEAAKTALDKGRDLESKLKTAYMAYRVAEAVWTQLGSDQNRLNLSKERADALQEVIDACWLSN